MKKHVNVLIDELSNSYNSTAINSNQELVELVSIDNNVTSTLKRKKIGSEVSNTPMKRKMGRPLGSKNKKTMDVVEISLANCMKIVSKDWNIRKIIFNILS